VESVYLGIQALRQIARVLDPTKGVGSLRVRLPDGNVRQIGATYAGGLDASTEDSPGAIWAPLVFRTPDPYWTDGITQTTQWPTGATSLDIVNDGDYDTWPIITLAGDGGPVDSPTLTNTAINKKIQITAAANQIVLDCRPGHRSVAINGIPNYGAMSADSEMWPLVAGAQVLSLAGPATATTRVTLVWARRFLAI
jgi:hypothetical protein